MVKVSEANLEKAVKKHFNGIKDEGLSLPKKFELAVKSMQEAETGNSTAPYTAIKTIGFGDCSFSINGIPFRDHQSIEDVNPRVMQSESTPSYTVVDGLPNNEREDETFPDFSLIRNMPNLVEFSMYTGLAMGDLTKDFLKTSKISIRNLFNKLQSLELLELGSRKYKRK